MFCCPFVLCDYEGVVIFGHCFFMHFLVSIRFLQSSAGAGRESWLLYFDAFKCHSTVSVLWLFIVTMGRSAVCDCDIAWSYSLTFPCNIAQSKSKSPHCKYHQQGSAVSYQNKGFTKVILLKPCPNPTERICDEIVKNYVNICVCIMYVFFDFSLTVKAAPHECVIRTGQS